LHSLNKVLHIGKSKAKTKRLYFYESQKIMSKRFSRDQFYNAFRENSLLKVVMVFRNCENVITHYERASNLWVFKVPYWAQQNFPTHAQIK
jgi:hypothetical protein